jgi:mannose/cellobiose epimerase-like protein (N-acyl-D-glucosamine 2-epimerase family)
MVVLFARAARALATDRFDPAIRHGLRFLREAHRDPATGGYAWMLAFRDGAWRASDADNQCYGLVHAMLAYAHAAMAGVGEATDWIAEISDTMDRHLWEEAHGLYADVASADWSRVDPYRGQNANMHGCEALMAAHAATGEPRYLARAARIAEALCVRQAASTGGLVWEHYRADWTADWSYNKGDFSNGYRPWGFQPGHQTEWTKLLLQLHARRPEAWMLDRARGPRAWRPRLCARARPVGRQRGKVFLGPDRVGCRRRPACPRDRRWLVLGAARQAVALLLGPSGRPCAGVVAQARGRRQCPDRRRQGQRRKGLSRRRRVLRPSGAVPGRAKYELNCRLTRVGRHGWPGLWRRTCGDGS